MESQESFGAILRREREDRKISQGELAKLCELSRLQIIRLENDQQGASWDTVKAICKALEVDCKKFMDSPAPDAKPAKPKKKGKGA